MYQSAYGLTELCLPPSDLWHTAGAYLPAYFSRSAVNSVECAAHIVQSWIWAEAQWSPAVSEAFKPFSKTLWICAVHTRISLAAAEEAVSTDFSML